ncbi:MAG: GPR endopeptidase [Clostridia bacterium]|nr:GPR endopeptidase [Clostridia bacterium]
MKHFSDLAAECRELVPDCEGICESEYSENGITVRTLEIKTDAAVEKIGRAKGVYTTVELSQIEPNKTALVIKKEIQKLLPKNPQTVLVAGLGNRNITPDAIGPMVAEGVLATRHISDAFARKIGLDELESVAVISPGVLGQTGIETAEIVKSTASVVNASAVIVVDALTAASVTRLGNTVQITNSGIHPGSGVGNKRSEISHNTLGIPCIAVGVPTVVNASTLVSESVGKEIKSAPEMIVTPKDIDSIITELANLLSLSINLALHPEISADVIRSII